MLTVSVAIRVLKAFIALKDVCYSQLALLYLRAWGVKIGPNFRSPSLPFCRRGPSAKIQLGSGVTILNKLAENAAGINHRTAIIARGQDATLSIGDKCGMSGAIIFCTNKVRIGNNVQLGAASRIYDTDFHPINYLERRENRREAVQCAPVIIEDDVWLGAGAVVLKGVRIGPRSIIAAGAVVSSDIPGDCIAGGIPAKVIRFIDAACCQKLGPKAEL